MSGVIFWPISFTMKKPQRRGFGAMDPEKRRAIARKGGASVAPQNRSFYKDRKLAAEAGSKGGKATKHDRT